MATQRGGRPWRRAQDAVRAASTTCALCGYPIDMEADRQRHPLASSVDHLVPLSLTEVTYDPSQLAHLHRLCNGIKYNKPITVELRSRCRAAVEHHMQRITVRTW